MLRCLPGFKGHQIRQLIGCTQYQSNIMTLNDTINHPFVTQSICQYTPAITLDTPYLHTTSQHALCQILRGAVIGYPSTIHQ